MQEIILTILAICLLILLFLVFDIKQNLKKLPINLKKAMDEATGVFRIIEVSNDLLNVKNELERLKKEVEKHKKQA